MALFTLPYLVVSFFVDRSVLGTILGFAKIPSQDVTPSQLESVLGAEAEFFAVYLGYLLLLVPIAQGAVIRVVGDDYLDRPTGVGTALGTALHRIWGLIGYVLLELAIWFVGPMALFTAVTALLALAGAGAAAVGMLIVLLIGWLVFLVFVYIRLSLGVQALILERISPWAAVRRSWRLTARSFWRIVGFYLVIAIVSAIVSQILDSLTGLVVGAAPLATEAAVQALASGVVGIFTSPFLLILLTLVYYDIRIRREAFDLEMLAQSL
jgi:hypothetical protein